MNEGQRKQRTCFVCHGAMDRAHTIYIHIWSIVTCYVNLYLSIA